MEGLKYINSYLSKNALDISGIPIEFQWDAQNYPG